MLTYKGDVNLCLKYVTSEQLMARRQVVAESRGAAGPSTGDVSGGELLVLVKQARNLTAVRSNGFSDPFCKWSVVSLIQLRFCGPASQSVQGGPAKVRPTLLVTFECVGKFQ